MYFTKINSSIGKHYKQHISGTALVKSAQKYSYYSNREWGFIEIQSGVQFMEGDIS